MKHLFGLLWVMILTLVIFIWMIFDTFSYIIWNFKRPNKDWFEFELSPYSTVITPYFSNKDSKKYKFKSALHYIYGIGAKRY